MTCAENPVRIDFSKATGQLVFSWPKSVHYSDGTVNAGVTFTVVKAKGLSLRLRRDRDGVMSSIVVSPDANSFQYEEAAPAAGSRFSRCDSLSS